MVASIYNDTTVLKMLKVQYDKGLENLFFGRSPFVAWVNKDTSWEGREWEITVGYGGGIAFSDFDNSKSYAKVRPLATFKCERHKAFTHGFIDNEVLKAAASNKGALARVRDVANQDAALALARYTEHMLVHSGGGALAEVGSISTDTITLANPDDVRHFQIGMPIQLSDDDGVSASGGVRDSGDFVSVTAVNYAAGTVTGDSAWATTISGASAGDFMYLRGTYQNKGNSIFSWIPETDTAAATTFLGQDRSSDIVSMAGYRVPLKGATMEEAIIEMLAKARFIGATVDTVWVSSSGMAELQKNSAAKTYHQADVKVSPTVSIGALSMNGGPRGKVYIMEEPALPKRVALATTRAAWKLKSADKWPHLSTEDGLQLARTHDGDQVEFTMKGYGNLGCLQPRNNVLGLLESTTTG